jgi:hypothetical protein
MILRVPNCYSFAEVIFSRWHNRCVTPWEALEVEWSFNESCCNRGTSVVAKEEKEKEEEEEKSKNAKASQMNLRTLIRSLYKSPFDTSLLISVSPLVHERYFHTSRWRDDCDKCGRERSRAYCPESFTRLDAPENSDSCLYVLASA